MATRKKKAAVAVVDEDIAGEVEETADDAPAKGTKKGKREKALVVVESPAKANTIKKYLGAGYTVKVSVGHIMDLPKSKMGVDVEKGFEPEYVPIRGKAKILTS